MIDKYKIIEQLQYARSEVRYAMFGMVDDDRREMLKGIIKELDDAICNLIML